MTDERPVDGITPPVAVPTPPPRPIATSAPEVPAALRKRMMRTLLLLLSIPYLLFLGWAFFLVSMLPNSEGLFGELIPIGKLSAMAALGVLAVVELFLLKHISGAKQASSKGRTMALLRNGLFALPIIGSSAAVLMLIGGEPALSLDIVSPTKAEEFVAPLAISYSAERAVEILGKRGLRPLSYAWDFDGDGKLNEETVVPVITALYDRIGGFNVVVRLQLSDGSTRRLARRLVIDRAVFSINPPQPIVDEPVTFSIAHLIPDPKTLREVQWDFNGDGQADSTSMTTDAVHTFVRTGEQNVSVVIQLTNQSQVTYSRVVTIKDPEPLPFPMTLLSEPQNLISPPPFGTIFRLETQESLKEVVWDFGDATPTTKTTQEHRVGHTYEKRGSFRLTATARSSDDVIAKISTVVRIVETLRLSDLSFDGQPAVSGNRITGEVPVNVNLVPRTTQPLIKFFWEAPEATTVGSTDTTLQAIYRRPGTYTIWLIAQDPDGRAMRLPIAVEVKPPTSLVSIRMSPEGGIAPLKVSFDASETVIPGMEISGFEWLFGNSTQGFTRRQGIAKEMFTFEKAGTYQVKLVVFTTTGQTYNAEKTIVVRPPLLRACFMPSRTQGALSPDGTFGVSFDRRCTTGDITSILWDFGDGSQSDDKAENIVHVYERAGVFDVKLTVIDSMNVRTIETKQIIIDPS